MQLNLVSPLLILLLIMPVVISREVLAEPFIPNDEDIIEVLPASAHFLSASQKYPVLQKKYAEAPSNWSTSIELAQLYFDTGIKSGDLRYLGYAKKTLEPWWLLMDPPPEILYMRSVIAQKQHNFKQALNALDQLLVKQPQHPKALLDRAMVQRVIGDLPGALRTCSVLQRYHNSLIASTCQAGILGLTQKAAEARNFLAYKLRQDNSSDAATQAWANTELADISLRLGMKAIAVKHYEYALKLVPDDIYTLAAYTDFLLGEKKYQQVKELLKDARGSTPLLLRLTIAEKHTDALSYSGHVKKLQWLYRSIRMRGEQSHLGSEARFMMHVMDDATAAFELAIQDWKLQRTPESVRLFLEAALESRNYKDAEGVISWVKMTGLQDERIDLWISRLDKAVISSGTL